MAFLFSKKPLSPEKVPTDDVIPVHYFDDSEIFRSLVVEFALRFDDVLDHEKLYNALVRLMEIGNWRKLGARLRLNDKNKLEYHIPAAYNDERPGFTYSHVEYDVKISEHPIGSKIPHATSRPSIVGNVHDFRPLTRAPNSPKSIDDFLYSDRPQLSVSIVSFKDATVVALSWPHTFLDAMGRVALFRNWIAVLEGREEDVQLLDGYDTDPLATLGTKPTEPLLLAKWQLSGLSMVLFVVRFVLDYLWYTKEETHVVCLPEKFVQGLKQEALEDLAKNNEKGDIKPFLSDGDIICAWWTRMVIGALRPSPNRTIAILNALGMRNVLSKDLLPENRAYVSNAAIGVNAYIPGGDVLTKPLSYVASKLREAIAQQATREQVEAFTYNMRKAVDKTGRVPLYGDSSMILVIFSNWSGAKFFQTDFSAAVVKEGQPLENRSNAVGRPSYINADGHVRGLFGRNAFPIMGRDAAGNYWLSGCARTEIWSKIKESLELL